jgi:class 3 adenylate cyclase
MQCPKCSATARVGAKFCEECGTALPRACPACGMWVGPQARFCGDCGTALANAPAAPELVKVAGPIPASPTPMKADAKAERRQLTIMFCDMVGSSALSARLDPEEQREVVAAFQAACADEIKRFEGMVAQYLGDGVLAYFGYPAAHEDDAERAVRAGLALLHAVPNLKPATGVTIQVRIGVATGVVVVGDLVRGGVTQENAAIGETTNLAARLQALAEPDSLVVAPDTHRLVGGLFEYRELGQQTLKGFAAPVHVRQVLRASAIENRFETRRPAGVAGMLGRDEELAAILRRWEEAKSARGRVVVITGEPGIGKSRLTRAVEERLAGDDHFALTYHCSPYHQNSALHPFIGQLTRGAGIEVADAAE